MLPLNVRVRARESIQVKWVLIISIDEIQRKSKWKLFDGFHLCEHNRFIFIVRSIISRWRKNVKPFYRPTAKMQSLKYCKLKWIWLLKWPQNVWTPIFFLSYKIFCCRFNAIDFVGCLNHIISKGFNY